MNNEVQIDIHQSDGFIMFNNVVVSATFDRNSIGYFVPTWDFGDVWSAHKSELKRRGVRLYHNGDGWRGEINLAQV